ncbi:hypothetical protein ACJRO7_027139 [Eucalyptus globulus]|uniref:RNase H type-1 domain-containing protein n=1 Tax=Eucalyptus globulus TaxID=34317 RepID=A0ABD3JVD3_EUCGL
MNSYLLETVQIEEVEEAVFQLGALKAPGPDGLNGQFYQNYWEELKHEVFQLVRLFFETGTRDLPEKELVATVLWFVWKARNNSIFRAKQPDPNTIVDLAQAHLQNFNRWQKKKETAKPPNPNSPRRWIPPEKGQLKLNVDASWIHAEQVGSVAGILRDHTGQLIAGFAHQVRASSPLQLETLAILHGL